MRRSQNFKSGKDWSVRKYTKMAPKQPKVSRPHAVRLIDSTTNINIGLVKI